MSCQRGVSMPARKHMSCCALFERYILVFGGLSPACQPLEEILLLSLEPILWQPLPLQRNSSMFRLFGHHSILHDNLYLPSFTLGSTY